MKLPIYKRQIIIMLIFALLWLAILIYGLVYSKSWNITSAILGLIYSGYLLIPARKIHFTVTDTTISYFLPYMEKTVEIDIQNIDYVEPSWRGFIFHLKDNTFKKLSAERLWKYDQNIIETYLKEHTSVVLKNTP
jgi:hypothetical protein